VGKGERRRECEPNAKKAQETSSTSLGPQVSFFFVTHLIFILLTKLFKYNFKLLTTTTTAPAPRLRATCSQGGLRGRRNDGEEKYGETRRMTKRRGEKGNETTGHTKRPGHTKRRGGKRNDGERRRRRRSDTPPTPSLTSNCSWGGSWVDRQRQRRAAGREDEDERQHTPRPQPHEQLLVGWIAGVTDDERTQEDPPTTGGPCPLPLPLPRISRGEGFLYILLIT
jgi:hypothetical protein